MAEKSASPKMIQDEVAEKRALMRLIAAREVAKRRIEFATHHHRNTRGQPLNFRYRQYLVQPYSDPSPDIMMRVPVQIGKTEWQVCDSLACADLGLSVFNVQPKFELRGVHVAERFDKLIGHSAHYLERVRQGHGSRDSTTLKHFGEGSLRFVGSRVESDMISFPADVLSVDEVDRCDLSILTLAEDRLQESDYKLIRRTSTPTLPGSAQIRNIDFYFNVSDQKRWHVPCPHCGEEQEIRWDTHLVHIERDDEGRIINATLVDKDWTEGAWRRRKRRIRLPCVACGKPLDRLSKGIWRPSNPIVIDVSGYTMSRLIAVTTQVEDVWLEFEKSLGNPSAMRRVINSLFGEPYSGIGDRFSADLLDSAAETIPPYRFPVEKIAVGGCTMGVDVNRPFFDVTISDYPYITAEKVYRRLVFAGRIRTERELRELIAKYQVRTCCVDSEPEARWSINFQNSAKCMVWRVQYRHGSEGLVVKDMNVDRKKGLITVDRTMALDDLLAQYSRRLVALPVNYLELCQGVFAKNLTAAVRVLETDNGVERYVWKADFCHFLHVENYNHIAFKVGHHVPAGTFSGFANVQTSRSETSEALDEFDAISQPQNERLGAGFGEGLLSDLE